MKCRECGAEMRVSHENWLYPDLSGVTLCNVEVRRCVNDTEHHEVELPHMEGLHQALAGALLTKRTLLAGPEIRFLRELSDWDATKLATLLSVTPVTLSRWENVQMGHSGMADRLLRMLVATALGLPIPRDVLEHISDIVEPIHVSLRFGSSGWRVVDESDPVSVWVSFADEDREAVIKALEASLESLKERVVHFSKAHAGEQGGAGKGDLVIVSAHKDPGRALRVAVDTLRALSPAPASPKALEVTVEP